MGSRAIGSIRATASQTSGKVIAGKAGIPYAGGWEFGSKGRLRQFPPQKAGGYNVYPALADERANILETYAAELDRIVDEAFG
jgi:hypothetical protein